MQCLRHKINAIVSSVLNFTNTDKNENCHKLTKKKNGIKTSKVLLKHISFIARHDSQK
jgi:hypothetical protein